MLITENSPYKASIVRNDPILARNIFSTSEISVYLAVKDSAEIHPMTLAQCERLAMRNKLKCFVKCK